MKHLRVSDLADIRAGHFIKGIIPGDFIYQGGMSFKKPGQRTHDVGCKCPSCDGKGRHVHTDDSEVFVILQGKGVMEINGKKHTLTTGDIMVCEPGEDHHLVADKDDPCINLWLHAGPNRAAGQG